MDPQLTETVETICRILDRSRSVLFVTGAGISADSGVPTYRGVGGLYEIRDTEEGLPIDYILSRHVIRERPGLTWKYLAQISDACRGATFNRAHEVIALLEQKLPRVWTLTQNVDGFHVAAGSQNVIEIHGNMRALTCMRCNHQEHIDPESNRPLPPICPQCDAIMRPSVVLFDEALPEHAVDTMYRELETGFDVIFSVGTSGSFPYIRDPLADRNRNQTVAIEINPDATTITPLVDYHLPMRAAEAMNAIWTRLESSHHAPA